MLLADSSHKNGYGFSLMVLLTADVIIGILSVIAIPAHNAIHANVGNRACQVIFVLLTNSYSRACCLPCKHWDF